MSNVEQPALFPLYQSTSSHDLHSETNIDDQLPENVGILAGCSSINSGRVFPRSLVRGIEVSLYFTTFYVKFISSSSISFGFTTEISFVLDHACWHEPLT